MELLFCWPEVSKYTHFLIAIRRSGFLLARQVLKIVRATLNTWSMVKTTKTAMFYGKIWFVTLPDISGPRTIEIRAVNE